LPELWLRLIEDEAVMGTVVEMRADSGEVRLAGFGCGAFVTGAWAGEASRGLEPYLAARTLLESPSPILRPPRLGRENAGRGLELVFLHYAEDPGLPPDTAMAVRFELLRSALATFSSYHVNSVLQEFWDEIPPEFIVHGWGRVRSDFGGYYCQQGRLPPPPGGRPYLIGITREEARADPGDGAAALFVHHAPRIRFSTGEKSLLRQALPGQTDPEIAAQLGIAMPSVKSRWRAVYERTAGVMPELLPAGPAGAGASAGAIGRGPEKRRLLLGYLRRHPEELRIGIDERRAPAGP